MLRSGGARSSVVRRVTPTDSAATSGWFTSISVLAPAAYEEILQVRTMDQTIEGLAGAAAIPDGHLPSVDRQVGAQTERARRRHWERILSLYGCRVWKQDTGYGAEAGGITGVAGLGTVFWCRFPMT
jgi:hypothetical protein